MSAHTPGPWTYRATPTGQFALHDPRGLVSCLTVGQSLTEADHMAFIASACNSHAVLLSALVTVEQAYSNRHSPQHRAACLIAARAAIAKAEGKA